MDVVGTSGLERQGGPAARRPVPAMATKAAAEAAAGEQRAAEGAAVEAPFGIAGQQAADGGAGAAEGEGVRVLTADDIRRATFSRWGAGGAAARE